MDDRGHLRELQPGEEPRSNEIVITRRAHDRLKHLSIRQRIKFRSLVQSGMSEEEALKAARGRAT